MPVAFAQTRVGPLMPRLKPSSRGVLLLIFKIENELEQVNGPWGLIMQALSDLSSLTWLPLGY